MRVFHHDLTIMYHHHGISFMAKIDFAAISSKTKIMGKQTSSRKYFHWWCNFMPAFKGVFASKNRIFICSS